MARRTVATQVMDLSGSVYGTILADRFEPALAVDGLGESYRIEENYFKFYACCRYNHFALDAIAAMRRAHSFSSEEVAVSGVCVSLGMSPTWGVPEPLGNGSVHLRPGRS